MPDDLLGKIVEITLEEYEGEPFRFFGQRGHVSEISQGHKDGPLGVYFPKWCRMVLLDERKHPIYFDLGEVRVCDDWGPIPANNLARFLEGDQWYSFACHRYALDPGKRLCEYVDCTNMSCLTAFENFWGNIQERYVCHEHAFWHRRRSEGGFPFRKDLPCLPVECEITERAGIEFHYKPIPGSETALFGGEVQIKQHYGCFIPGHYGCEHPDHIHDSSIEAWYVIWVKREKDEVEEVWVCGEHAALHGKELASPVER